MKKILAVLFVLVAFGFAGCKKTPQEKILYEYRLIQFKVQFLKERRDFLRKELRDQEEVVKKAERILCSYEVKMKSMGLVPALSALCAAPK